MNRIIFPLLLGISFLSASPAFAQPASSNVQLAPNAPDSYTVVKGDTLWGISGRFLRDPWRWPQVWQMNRAQIRNPHLIYPGQVVYLDRSGPWLRIGKPIGGTDRLQPKIYEESLDQALPSIPQQAIEPFLTRQLVLDESGMQDAATIVATETSRVLTGPGDTIFAKDVDEQTSVWQILRPAQPLKDPLTGEVVAYEAHYVGTARVTGRSEEVTTLEITAAVEEVGTGDLMLPSETPQVFSYPPHAPEQEVEARVLSIYRGVSETGRLHVITLGAGTSDGIELGHVLSLARNRGVASYRGEEGQETFQLPEQNYGLVFVFRVFDRVSYALVMETDGQVTVGDVARKP